MLILDILIILAVSSTVFFPSRVWQFVIRSRWNPVQTDWDSYTVKKDLVYFYHLPEKPYYLPRIFGVWGQVSHDAWRRPPKESAGVISGALNDFSENSNGSPPASPLSGSFSGRPVAFDRWRAAGRPLSPEDKFYDYRNAPGFQVVLVEGRLRPDRIFEPLRRPLLFRFPKQRVWKLGCPDFADSDDFYKFSPIEAEDFFGGLLMMVRFPAGYIPYPMLTEPLSDMSMNRQRRKRRRLPRWPYFRGFAALDADTKTCAVKLGLAEIPLLDFDGVATVFQPLTAAGAAAAAGDSSPAYPYSNAVAAIPWPLSRAQSNQLALLFSSFQAGAILEQHTHSARFMCSALRFAGIRAVVIESNLLFDVAERAMLHRERLPAHRARRLAEAVTEDVLVLLTGLFLQGIVVVIATYNGGEAMEWAGVAAAAGGSRKPAQLVKITLGGGGGGAGGGGAGGDAADPKESKGAADSNDAQRQRAFEDSLADFDSDADDASSAYSHSGVAEGMFVYGAFLGAREPAAPSEDFSAVVEAAASGRLGAIFPQDNESRFRRWPKGIFFQPPESRYTRFPLAQGVVDGLEIGAAGGGGGAAGGAAPFPDGSSVIRLVQRYWPSFARAQPRTTASEWARPLHTNEVMVVALDALRYPLCGAKGREEECLVVSPGMEANVRPQNLRLVALKLDADGDLYYGVTDRTAGGRRVEELKYLMSFP